MGGEFEWIPWSDREDSFVEHAVPLGLKDGFITYIARVKRGGVVSGSDEQSFGIVMRSKGRGAEIIGADGVMEQVADYEVLTADDRVGYYWAPNRAGYIPQKALEVGTSRENNDRVYLARTYAGGKFNCGFATGGKCYYQEQGQKGLSMADNYEILVESIQILESNDYDKSKDAGTDGCSSEDGNDGGGGGSNGIIFGWTRWKENISRRFFVSAGKYHKSTVYVMRATYPSGMLAFVDVMLEDQRHSWDDYDPPFGVKMLEVLLANPGSYFWVDSRIAKSIYVKDLGGDNGKRNDDNIHASDRSNAWKRRLRRNPTKGHKSEWDYWLGRTYDSTVRYYKVGQTSCHQWCEQVVAAKDRKPTIPDEHKAERYECLVVTYPEMNAGPLDDLQREQRAHEKQTSFQVPRGALGWMPLKDAKLHSFVHAIRSISPHVPPDLGNTGQSTGGAANKWNNCKNIVARKVSTQGHWCGEIAHFDETLPAGHFLEVLWGSGDSFTWLPDKEGYVPRNAVPAGATRSDQPVYVGSHQVSESAEGTKTFHIGTILPITKGIPDSPRESFFKASCREYKVLCVRYAEEDLEHEITEGPVENDAKGSGQGSGLEARFVERLIDLQKAELHGEGKESYDRNLSEALEGTQLESMLNSSDWIPFVSRLARIHGLPGTVWQPLFKYIEFSRFDDTAKEAGLSVKRVASIFKHAVQAGATKGKLYFEDMYYFGPLLHYVTSLSNKDGVDVISTVLETLVAFLEDSKARRPIQWTMLCQTIRSDSWEAIVGKCLLRLGDKRRFHLGVRFEALGIESFRKLMPAYRVVQPADGDSKDDIDATALGKLRKLKRKSLAVPTAAGSRAPPANTVIHQQLQSQNFQYSSEVESELEPISLHHVQDLYEETCKLKSSEQGNGEGMTQGSVADGGWVTVLNLAKQLTGSSATEIVSYEYCVDSQLPTLIESAPKPNIVLTEAILTLINYAVSTGLIQLNQSHLDYAKEVLKMVTTRINAPAKATQVELQHTSAVTRLVLTFLCETGTVSQAERPSFSETDAADVMKVVISILRASEDKVSRILCAWYIARKACHGQHLEVDDLMLMATLADDPVRDIRILARVAFSNGLYNHLDENVKMGMLVDHFATIFVTQPALLASLGSLTAEDFTYKINGNLIHMADAVMPDVLEGQYRKFMENSVSFKTMTVGCFLVLKEIFKKAPKWKRRDKSLKALEKLFLRANKEDNENLAVQVLSAIVGTLEEGHYGLEYRASEGLLKVISRRMIGQKDAVYLQCLHLFSSLQEFPHEVFLYYHLEIAPLRIPREGTSNSNMKKFLERHDLNCRRSHVSHLARHIESYYEKGFLLSRRTVQQLIGCLSTFACNKKLWDCFLKMADVGHYFSEPELEVLFADIRFRGDEEGRPIWVDTCLKVVQNQNLPQGVSNRILMWAKGKLTTESLNLTASLFKYEEDPGKIVALVKGVALNAFKNDKFQSQGRGLLQRVLRVEDISVENVETFKNEFLGNSTPPMVHFTASAAVITQLDLNSNLELLLQLMIRYPDQVTWADLNKLASEEGPSLVGGASKEILRNIHRLWREAAVRNPKRTKGPEFHTFFHIIHVMFCDEPQDCIRSLCHYVTDKAGQANKEQLHLQMHHLEGPQETLAHHPWAAQAVLEALDETKKVEHVNALGSE